MTNRFAHLHVHTEYSLLDGLSRLEETVERAAELGMDALAITDHGALYGAIDFYRIAKRHGVKPIIGCEVYVAPESRHSREPADKRPYHMTILAKNETGYKNLVKAVSKAQLEGFYYKPRLDRELLEQYREGLIVLSGCPSAEVPRAIAEGRLDDARAAAGWYRDMFEDYYLELMRHGGVPDLPTINKGLIALSKEMDIPLVATNDLHYVHQADAPLQDILICIHTNTNVEDPKRLRMTEDSYYLKSPDEMAELFADVPEALANTVAIAEMCELELTFDTLRLPEYVPPDGLTANDYLRQICREGLDRRLPEADERTLARFAYELDVIEQTQYPNYFLVVWDIAHFVREKDIFFAVRGSAAASLVLFCLGVTDINPLKYDLVFERFLNLERKEMPDIDMDFQDDRRDEVINYVVDRYSSDHVAQIITFGTLGARAAIRDSGRALAMSYGDVDAVARLVPQKLHITLDESLDSSPEMAELYDSDSAVKKLLDTARGVEGLARHSSTHAAGVVISKEPLEEYVPLQRPVKGDEHGVNTTQYAMEPVAALGLLKMDFLGLANLTILARARDLVHKRTGTRLELPKIPLDDRKTFDLLSRGETVGVFQMEGSGMTRYIQNLKPSSLGDVAAMIALYRPGPMEHIDTFIDAKFGRAAPEYPHPDLEEILRETYGVIVFQDQVLHIARKFAGYSLGEADIVRKAMGKKVPEIMAKERERFIEGALAQGYSQEVADRVFALVEPFAGYAFNKAHSVSYGLISYWTAYFKAHHPGEYMVSLLATFSGNADKIASAVAECARLGIPVRVPDVNLSGVDFTLDNGDGVPAIRFGMASVKNVGPGAVEPIIAAREEHGPFASIEEMCRVADLSAVNRKALESLIKAGAFDGFGDRTSILSAAPRIGSLAQSEAGMKGSDQTTMFDMFGESVDVPLAQIEIEEGSTSERQKGDWEMELLGVDLSVKSSIASLAASADPSTILSRDGIRPGMNGMRIDIAGQVESVTNRFTRDDRPFTIASLRMLGGEIDVFVWEELQKTTADVWQEGRLVKVVGTVRDRGDDRVSISAISAEEHPVEEGVQVPNAPAQPPAPPSSAPPVAAPTSESNGVTPDVASPGPGPAAPVVATNGVKAAPANGAAPVVQRNDGAASTRKRLSLRIVESGELDRDRQLLDRVVREMLQHGGHDEVGLEIATGGRLVSMDWPRLSVAATEELAETLAALLGDSGQVSLEA